MKFYKYQGTGNDFILVDNRTEKKIFSQEVIAHLCDRRFGIGADGLILLENDSSEDFKMVYFNADGNESSMCGNGGRCIVAFARDLNIVDTQTSFRAIDGLHNALLDKANIHLQMQDVANIAEQDGAFVLNTGSPHYVNFINSGLETLNVFEEGRKIRNSASFHKEGINVNFVQIEGNSIYVRTYERGVEDETFSCGTGVTAAAIGTYLQHGFIPENIKTLGGVLKVKFDTKQDRSFQNIWLIGPAQKVFEGTINIPL